MPGFDGTGPLAGGPMTGGGFGYCGTGRRPGYGLGGRAFYGRVGGRGPGFGRGRWLRRGAGQGYGYSQPLPQSPETELAELREETEDLKAYLKDVEARIAAVEKASK
jgi:hypothetical protein